MNTHYNPHWREWDGKRNCEKLVYSFSSLFRLFGMDDRSELSNILHCWLLLVCCHFCMPVVAGCISPKLQEISSDFISYRFLNIFFTMTSKFVEQSEKEYQQDQIYVSIFHFVCLLLNFILRLFSVVDCCSIFWC